MAVPKKRRSKMKTRSTKANWYKKAELQSQRALILAKSILSGNESTSFVYDAKEESSE